MPAGHGRKNTRQGPKNPRQNLKMKTLSDGEELCLQLSHNYDFPKDPGLTMKFYPKINFATSWWQALFAVATILTAYNREIVNSSFIPPIIFW